MKGSIVVEGVRLAYVEVNSNQSETIFFVHNNSGSSNIWSKQLKEPALSGYRLIAIDLPAHGESSDSTTPELHYGLSDLGRLIGQAIHQLATDERYITVGCSLGANVVTEALLLIKPKGIVLVGPTVVGREVSFSSIGKPDVDASALFSDSAPKEQVAHLMAKLVYKKDPATLEDLLHDYHQAKLPFRSMMFQLSIEEGKLSDEISLLNRVGVPTMIVIGAEDEMIKPDYLDNLDLNKWHESIYKVPAAGHLVHLDQPEGFNKLLLAYAKEIFTGDHA